MKFGLLCAALVCAAPGCSLPTSVLPSKGEEVTVAKRLTHEETLRWIAAHRAWRIARKTKPIWARPVSPAEVGKEYLTADGAVERARADAWLSVGSSGEPWFQNKDKLDAKYEASGREERRFSFDDAAHSYQRFTPRADARNWAAQIDGSDIEGFSIQPNYPTDKPLYSRAGGYVVRDYVDDPYAASPDDVWLVQKQLFESTYELEP